MNVLDLVLTVRDEAGTLLSQNNDRDPDIDPCPGLAFDIPPGAIVFAHLTDFGDDSTADYLLEIDFP